MIGSIGSTAVVADKRSTARMLPMSAPITLRHTAWERKMTRCVDRLRTARTVMTRAEVLWTPSFRSKQRSCGRRNFVGAS